MKRIVHREQGVDQRLYPPTVKAVGWKKQCILTVTGPMRAVLRSGCDGEEL